MLEVRCRTDWLDRDRHAQPMLALILLNPGFVLFVLAGILLRSRFIPTKYILGWLGMAC